MDNIVVLESSSDSDYSDTSSDHDQRDEILYENTHFMNHVEVEQYKTNRNKYFTPDIEKKYLLVDTNNIDKVETLNTNNYTYYLDSNNDSNIKNGYEKYDNVIGFRLIRALIPNSAYTVNEMNDTVIYNASGIIHTIKLKHGYYSIEDLKDSFYESIDNTTYPINSSNISYDNTTHKFTFNASGLPNIQFDWSTNDTTKNAAKLFGFYTSSSTSASNITSDFVPDLSNHYVDVCVDEIPNIACKHNSYGNKTIERIHITTDFGQMCNHESIIYGEQNYFFPISLNKLSIKLYSDNGKTLYDSQNANHSLEFELTILKNLELVV